MIQLIKAFSITVVTTKTQTFSLRYESTALKQIADWK